MEMEKAIERHASPAPRRWAPRRSDAWVACAALALVAVAFWASQGLGAQRAAYALIHSKALSVDSPIRSFGVVSPGESAVVSYRLTNHGSQNIRIVGCQAFCSCVVPKELPFTLRPKESRDFPVVLRSSKNDSGQPVTIDWEITLFTTDPAQVRIPLTLKGEIRAKPAPSVSGL